MNIANNTIANLPEKPAVYKMYQRGRNGTLKLLYVGRTKNLRYRLFNHAIGFDEFTFEIIESTEKRQAIEEYLIQEFEPPFNEQYNPSPFTFHPEDPNADGVNPDNETSTDTNTPTESVGDIGEQLLANVNDEPFLPIGDRYDAIDVDSKKGTAVKKNLLNSGLIEEVEVDTGKPGRNPKLLELTGEGKQILADRGYDVVRTGRRGIVHRYWQQKIQEFYEDQGFDTESEYSVGRHRIDVHASNGAETIAVEVACSPKHEVENVEKCLKQEIDSIQVACTKSGIEETVRMHLIEELGDVPEEVEILLVTEFL